MRIAQVSPLWEPVPPRTYGGIELVVSLLTDELVRRGHEVTLFASGDSCSLGQLEAVHPQALRLDTTVKEPTVYELLQLSRVYERATEFDIIHCHMGCIALPYASFAKTPTLHTLHGLLTPDSRKLFAHAWNQPYVSISQAQQRHLDLKLNYVATVYNGIDASRYPFYPQPEDPPYLAFLGRLSPEKGVHHAIAIARECGLPLKLAGKVDTVDLDYYQTKILPHIDGQQVMYLGEVNHAQKSELMGKALATLFPITWHEPFGLVMVESMATGTPVVAIALGSTPEVIADGKTGILCHSVAECIAAVAQIPTLDRATCRAHVLKHFSVRRMVDGYEAVYQQILETHCSLNGSRPVEIVG